MPFCPNCGKEFIIGTNFCLYCGRDLRPFSSQFAKADAPPNDQQPATPPQTAAPSQSLVQPISSQSPQFVPQAQTMPQAQKVSQPQITPATKSESVIGVIPSVRKMKSLGRYDEFNLVLTTGRVLALQITASILKNAAMSAKEQAKAEGKGFFGQWGAQLNAASAYVTRYISMAPDDMLSETPGNYAVDNNTISKVNARIKPTSKGGASHEDTDLEIEFESSMAKQSFRMDDYSESIDLLKQVFGDRLKMPFGYFARRSYGIRIKI